eukprot:7399222-Alexandrium_andersonii.AAC.1
MRRALSCVSRRLRASCCTPMRADASCVWSPSACRWWSPLCTLRMRTVGTRLWANGGSRRLPSWRITSITLARCSRPWTPMPRW